MNIRILSEKEESREKCLQGLFNKSFEELSGVHSDCLTTGRYIQHSAEQIESSGQTCKQIEDSLSHLCESLEKTNLPVNFK